MNKSQKSDIDAIVCWIPIKSIRDAIRNIYYDIMSKKLNLIYHRLKLILFLFTKIIMIRVYPQ